MLLDSNIIIYAAQPHHEFLRAFICEHAPAVSAISYLEVLGYHQLSDLERCLLEEFFAAADVIPISGAVIAAAAELRQQHRMSLGDSIVAATAIVHNKTLLTHNTRDFARVKELRVLDPMAMGG